MLRRAILFLYSGLFVACTSLSTSSQSSPLSYEWTQWKNPEQIIGRRLNFRTNLKTEDEGVLLETPLPAASPPRLPQKIDFIGDTGCRLKESKTSSEHQDCLNPKDWPIQDVLSAAVKDQPDLIIHLGDYHYREQCSHGELCDKLKAQGIQVGYTPSSWRADWFEPSRVVPKSIPWLLVRGNHEDCQRAHAGYFKWLATSGTSDCGEVEPAQYFVFTDAHKNKLLWIDFDSSAFPDKPEDFKKDRQLKKFKEWQERFQEVVRKIDSIKPTFVWFMTHKPTFAFVVKNGEYAPAGLFMESAMSKAGLLKKIDLLFAGHVHSGQILALADSPPQLLVGHSGSSLDVLQYSKEKAAPSKGYLWSATEHDHDFGYMTMIQGKTLLEWTIEFKKQDGTAIQKCLAFKASGKPMTFHCQK